MKKNILIWGALTLAVLFTSCAKEYTAVEPAANLTKMTINAEFPEFNNETRTQLGSDGVSVLWNADDEIMTTLYNNPSGRIVLKNTAGEASVAAFNGTVDFSNFLDSPYLNRREIFVYPANEGICMSYTQYYETSTINVKDINVPDTQTLTPDSFDRKAAPSIALFDINTLQPSEDNSEISIGNTANFKSVCGLLGLAIKSDEDIRIKSIKIAGPGSLTGKIVLQPDNYRGDQDCSLLESATAPENAVYAITSLTNNSTEVNLVAEEEDGFKIPAEGVKLYASVLPYYSDNSKSWSYYIRCVNSTTAIAGDYTISITRVDGAIATRTITLTEAAAGTNSAVMAGHIRVLGKFNITNDMFKTPLSMSDFEVSIAADALPAFKDENDNEIPTRTWMEGDDIATRENANSTNYKLTYGAATGTFTGIWNMSVFDTQDYKLNTEFFVYPAECLVGNGENNSNINITRLVSQPEKQKLIPDSYDADAALVAALYDINSYDIEHKFNTSLKFYNISGLLGVKLTGNATIKQIVITAKNGCYLGGSFFLQNSGREGIFETYSRNSWGYEPAMTDYPSVTLADEAGVALEGGKTFYACVTPFARQWNNNYPIHQSNTTAPWLHGAQNGTYNIEVTTTDDKFDLDVEVTEFASGMYSAVGAGHARTIATINVETKTLVTE